MKGKLQLLLLVGLCVDVNSFATKGGETFRKEERDFPRTNQTSSVNVLDPSHVNKSEDQLPAGLSISDITEMNCNFGFNLYRKMADKHDNNVFFSPLSVYFALASLMLGTKGITHEQLLLGLNLNTFNINENPYLLPTLLKIIKGNITKNEEFVLELGSFSFIHELFPIKETFLKLTSEYFDLQYQMVDFQNSTHAKNIINHYVSKKTQGKIPQLYDDVDPQTKLVLIDYILFKGKWLYPFNPSLTETDTFFIDKYNSVKVPMMYKADKVSSMFDRTLSCTVLKLPYRGSAHMLIVMPEKDGDFVTLEDHLTKELVDTWLANMKTRKTDIFFPKFKLDQKYQLKTFLQELGIKDIFTGRANLTGLTDERNIKLTEITQRAVIEIDERGTEASAATGSEIVAFSLPPTIKVDHPFLLMIYEETHKTLLFIGRVVDPTKF